MDSDILRKKIDELFWTRAYDRIEGILLQHKKITAQNSDLTTVCCLMEIYKKEKNVGLNTILDKTGSVSALLERYTILKFYLRRIDFDFLDENIGDFYQFVVQNEVSVYELLTIIEYSVVHKEKVHEIIQRIMM